MTHIWSKLDRSHQITPPRRDIHIPRHIHQLNLSPTRAIGRNSLPSRTNMPWCLHVVYLGSKAIVPLSRNLASSDNMQFWTKTTVSAGVHTQQVPYIHVKLAHHHRDYLRCNSTNTWNLITIIQISQFWSSLLSEYLLKWVNSDSISTLEPLFLNCELVGQRFPFVGENVGKGTVDEMKKDELGKMNWEPPKKCGKWDTDQL